MEKVVDMSIKVAKKANKKFKKLTLYKKSLLIFTLCLVFLQIIALVHVYNSLIMYETYELDNYMNNFASEIEDAIRRSNFSLYGIPTTIKNPYESETSLAAGMKSVIGKNKLTYEETDKENIFAINVKDKTLFFVELEEEEKLTRLSLLTITKYKVKNIKVESEEGVYHADIYAPSNYKVLINKIDVRQEDIKEKGQIEELADGYEYASLPTTNHYRITNLTNKPVIDIYDELGNPVSVEEKNSIYKVESSIKNNDDILEYINPLEVARTWSLFLSNDASVQAVNQYLIPGTKMYNKAKTWSTGVDKTFTASHYLADPAFENETIEGIEIYSENAFKVDVKLDKNLILSKNNQKKKITMHESLYFVKYNGEYKLINMISL